MATQKGLGRGLDSLIAIKKENDAPQQPDAMVKISLVEPNREQPRKNFDDEAMEELTRSVSAYGVIQPLIVVKMGGKYQIVAGERRWRAAQKAGLKEVPVIIRDYTPTEIREIALIENIQRQDLNPIEEAEAYAALIKEHGIRQDELAEKLSKSRAAVANRLRLLKLPESVRNYVIEGKLSEGHARAILGAEGKELQEKIAEEVLLRGLSVRETEKLAKGREIVKKPAREAAWKKEDKAFYKKLEDDLKAGLGTKVTLKRDDKEKGKIVVEYYSLEELERLAEIFCKGNGED